MIKNIIKNVLIFLPVIYSIIRLKVDFDFYIIFLIIYTPFILLYFIYRNKKYYSYIIQIGISCIFLDLTFHNINFKFFFNYLKLINFNYLLVIIPILFFGLFIRAYKWKYLLGHIKPIRLSSLFKATIMGFAVNSILPARAGELYRAFFLSKLEKISKSTVFATVILERIVDGLVVGIAVIYILLIRIIKPKIFYNTGIIAGSVSVFAIATLVLFYSNKDSMIKIIRKALFFLPYKVMNKLCLLLNSFYEGLHIFSNLKKIFFFTAFTIIIWIIIGLVDYLFLESMGIFKVFNFGISNFNFIILLMVCMVLGVALPGGPGGMGPLHYLIKYAFLIVLNSNYLNSNPVKYNLILAFAMYIWLCPVLICIISGLVVLTMEHIKSKIN